MIERFDGKLPCIIVDVDGTVANNEHRTHMLEETPKNWQKFFDASVDDTPIEPVKFIVNTLFHHSNLPIMIVTARDENHRELTEDWLEKHGIEYNQYYCRCADDRREDYVIKREILEQIRADGFEPVMAFEDRKQVKRMFESEGIFVFDVNQTDHEF